MSDIISIIGLPLGIPIIWIYKSWLKMRGRDLTGFKELAVGLGILYYAGIGTILMLACWGLTWLI